MTSSPPRSPSTTTTTRTRAELAAALGVTTRTLRRWLRAGMPGGAEGPWDPPAIALWARRRRSANARRGPGEMAVRVGLPPAPVDDDADDGKIADGDAAEDDAADVVIDADGDADADVNIDILEGRDLDLVAKRAAARYRVAKAQREEVALAKMRGELIERDGVDRLLVARAMTLRRDLLAASRRLAPIVVGLDVRGAAARIDDEHRRLLERYSRDPNGR